MTQQEFEQRYLPLAPRLKRMALALLGNADDAKDALQETYLRLWQQSERISELRSPEAFFLLTMRNYCLNQLRSRRKTIQPEAIDELADDFDADLSEQLHADLRRLRLALAQLKPKMRSAITMQYFDGLSTRDIAFVLGETPANTRSMLSRAREQLRTFYKTHNSDSL